MHGFDEFFGNLYHLNAEEEPERRTTREDPEFREALRPARRASTAGPPTRTTRRSTTGSGASASRRIEDTGPLTKKRMETIDDETSDAARRLHQAAARGRQAVLLLV